MTLYVDYRAGSHELVEPLRALKLPVEEVELEFGDLAFTGRGEKGTPVEIGVEFKQLSECVTSMRTGRLQGHQLGGMRKAYDHCWLVIEGDMLYDAKGRLQQRRGRRRTERAPLAGGMGVGEWLHRLLVLQLCGGLHPWMSRSRADTLRFLSALYRVWTDKDLDQHKSHLGLYVAPTLIPISEFRQAICRWPHIGLRMSKAVEDWCGGSIQTAANASIDRWASLVTTDDRGKTRRLGEKRAAEIVQFLQGHNETRAW